MTDRRILVPWFLDRKSDAVVMLSEPDDTIVDTGPGAGDQADSLAPIHKAIADAVSVVVSAGERPIATLGDCCQVIGVLAGLKRSGIAPALIWLDSHGDFNTWETTPSGFLGGMPLAMLTGRGEQRMLKAVELEPLADQRVTLCDARDLDPDERPLIEASQIHHHKTLAALLRNLPTGPLYVHFDSDIIDSGVAPAFLYPVRGGPSPLEVREALAEIQATGRVIAFSITAAWDPAKDPGRMTESAVRLALGGLANS